VVVEGLAASASHRKHVLYLHKWERLKLMFEGKRRIMLTLQIQKLVESTLKMVENIGTVLNEFSAFKSIADAVVL
jgi:hypothetical protein